MGELRQSPAHCHTHRTIPVANLSGRWVRWGQLNSPMILSIPEACYLQFLPLFSRRSSPFCYHRVYIREGMLNVFEVVLRAVLRASLPPCTRHHVMYTYIHTSQCF